MNKFNKLLDFLGLRKNNTESTLSIDCGVLSTGRTISPALQSKGLNFTIYTADGGHIIETHDYDKVIDRQNNKLYIITNDDDFGEKISHIITYELLRR